MTERGRRTAVLVAGVVLTAFLALVVSSVSGGGDDGGSGRSETDGAFIAGMVPHHSSSAELAQIAAARSKRREVKRLAQVIVDLQIEQIGVLRSIHERLFGAPLSTMSAGDHGGLPGVSPEMRVSPADLEASPQVDRDFLDAMVPQHQSAIRMARQELGNGRDAELRRIARRIVDTQSREVATMRTLRERWYGAR